MRACRAGLGHGRGNAESPLLSKLRKSRQQPTAVANPAHANILQIGIGQVTENRIIHPLVQKVLEQIFSLLRFQDRFQL
jgi:hypothetical protein